MPNQGKRPLGLTVGRPPLMHEAHQKKSRKLPSKITRSIIRRHHQLHKQLNDAVKVGDTAKTEDLRRQIGDYGGLEAYQSASIAGQSSERGGDSSRVLMHWLEGWDLRWRSRVPKLHSIPEKEDSCGRKGAAKDGERLRLLEVGALSTANACSRSGIFDVTRIDLNSQAPGIQQQDFMQRPSPTSDKERFDVLSLSLVLNYVPDAAGRGDMLRRTRDFLQQQGTMPLTGPASMKIRAEKRDPVQEDETKAVFPLLFLVLPAPCLTNSRYMDEARLGAIMTGLGYALMEKKISPKLYYSLWRLAGQVPTTSPKFPKTEVNPGKSRNNFCVILR